MEETNGGLKMAVHNDNLLQMPKKPKWKVYFDGGFWGHHGRDHAGIEIDIGKEFLWGGSTQYYIELPAAHR